MDAHPAGMMGHSWAWVWGIRDTSFPVPALRVYPFKSGGIARRTPALRVSRCMHIQRLEGEFFPGASQALYATAVLGDLGDVQILFVLLVRSSLRAFGVQSLLLLEVDLCVSARNHQCR